MLCIACDWIKAGAKIICLLLSKLFQLRYRRNLCQRHYGNIMLQPVDKLCNCHSITDMCLFFICYFCLILYRLPTNDRTDAIHNFYIFRKVFHNNSIHCPLIHKNTFICRKILYICVNFLIRIEHNPCFGKLFLILFTKNILSCKEVATRFFHDQI